MDLFGKVAIVTGGGTGIGYGIAKTLASKGARLVLAQNTRDGLQEAATSIDALATVVNITNRDMVFALVQWVEQRLGPVHILVNNAAVTGPPALHSFLDCTTEQLDQIVDVNLKGTFSCSQAVARSMVNNGVKGSIIHISSAGAFAAQENASLDCATKAAVSSMAKTMALELAPYGIRVNAIAPGDIETESNARVAQGKYTRVTPLDRRGSPEDVGHAVAFLASENASFITGTTLLVDGGWLSY